MQIKDHASTPTRNAVAPILTIAGLLGALAASSCCLLPLAFFAFGISGAWIGNFTRLAPFQPCFILLSIGFIASGYRAMHRSADARCGDEGACRRVVSRPLLKAAAWLAIILVIAAIGFDLAAPLLLDS